MIFDGCLTSAFPQLLAESLAGSPESGVNRQEALRYLANQEALLQAGVLSASAPASNEARHHHIELKPETCGGQERKSEGGSEGNSIKCEWAANLQPAQQKRHAVNEEADGS